MKDEISQHIVDKRKYSFITFAIIFVICIIYAFYRGTINPIYDSSYYCGIGDGVVDKSGIHLNMFPQTFRGCLLPIFIQILKISPLGINWGWKIVASVVTSILFSYRIPRIISDKGINNQKNLVSSVISSYIYIYIYIYIWGDFITYPLSDLIAFFFMAVAVLCSKIIIENAIKEAPINYGIVFTLGLAFYIAYNTRCTYFYGIILLALVEVVIFLMKRRFSNLLISLVVITIGLCAISLPQCLVNSNCEGVFSPRVYTENYSSSASNLQMQQIVWGIQYPRYETYSGIDGDYPTPGVFFVDSTGLEIIERESISVDTFSMKKWVGLVAHYPLDMVSIYAKHFVNAMTPLWNRAYIEKINTNKIPIICISFLIWFICFLEILRKYISKSINWINAIIVGAACIPAFMQIMGAVEIRFLLPVYIFAYGYISIGVDYYGLLKWCRDKWLPIVMVFILVFSTWLAVISSTLADNMERTLLIDDKNMVTIEEELE